MTLSVLRSICCMQQQHCTQADFKGAQERTWRQGDDCDCTHICRRQQLPPLYAAQHSLIQNQNSGTMLGCDPPPQQFTSMR